MVKQETRSEELLYERVADHITQLIDQGTLHAGERLPSIRKLSSQMEVSISTVLHAYMVLEDKDWIEPSHSQDFTYGRRVIFHPSPSRPVHPRWSLAWG